MEKDNTKITLTVTVDQGNVILAALSKLPYEVSAELIHQIRQEANTQLQAPSQEAVIDK